MDSVTQIALGGAVAYGVLGKQVGRKAIVWGAILGTLPDLDVLIPYGDPIADFTYHRGFSHSLPMHILVSPVIAWLICAFHNRGKSGTESHYRPWVLAVFLCLSTHAILDSFTVYGTQLLWPFTEYPFALSNLFIIDPLVTIPLLVGCIVALLPRINGHRSYCINTIGLILCCGYITWSIGSKMYIDSKIEQALSASSILPSAYVSSPAPLNTLLWRAVAHKQDKYYEIYASIFDDVSEVSIERYQSQPELLIPIQSDWGVKRLQWFTKGLYAVSEDNNKIVITDLRMGVECAYAFNFIVAEKTLAGTIRTDYEQLTLRPDLAELGDIFKRILDPSMSLAPKGKRLNDC